ncbi:MAG TPA: OB-fold nucleic acid binding domain-containing protein [Acidimicrobiia bacterium]|nr:OB-fold nucleic acid binding domain-containing protein [Acidimicrobiia bacterium]
MGIKKFTEKFTKPIDEQDRERLVEWSAEQGGTPLDGLQPRQPVRVAGEVRSVRIVPRAGAASLEATVHDGRGAVTAVFLGRRKIPGLSPGRRVLLEGVVCGHAGPKQGLIYNPVYQLL